MIIACEKILTYLAMPCGLIWLALMALALLAWRRKQRPMLVSLLVLLGFYTVAGNDELSKLLFVWLERDYAAIDPFAQTPCDAVLVLGGGVDVAANGQSQLSLAGDRPALAVRLFHAGRTQRLVTSGMIIVGPRHDRRDLAVETTRIWLDCGVPEDRILQIQGRNTREEMAAMRELAGRHPEWKRLGVVTSAWHMKRALRLAEANGLSVQPLPADFRGTAMQGAPWAFIPTGSGFLKSELACKEILAGLVAR